MWVSPDEKQRNPRTARGRDQNWSHRYERKACEKLGTRSLRHLYPARALRLLPQGSDKSARHLLKLTQLTFAAGYRRGPTAPRSGEGRATPSGRARDPGSPIPSPFIPFRPWGSRSASPGLRESRESWAQE